MSSFAFFHFLLPRIEWVLGAFAKLQKAAIMLFLSVCPSVLLHGKTQLPMKAYFHEILSIFRKYVNKIKVSLKPDNNYIYLT
jgi:hypothetical protein